jgi:hypothetical protein
VRAGKEIVFVDLVNYDAKHFLVPSKKDCPTFRIGAR